MRAKGWLVGWILGTVASVLMSAPCFGAGFAIWEGSARGTSLGQAMVGRADDPSAVFYDPAGITQLPGLQMMVGGAGILTSTEVNTPLGSQSTINDWAMVPNIYLTYQCCDRLYLGLGIFTPFGLSNKFPDDWFGGFNSYYAQVQSATVNPNLAFKINDQLSVAAGFEAMEFGLTLKQLAPNPFAPNPFFPPTALSTKISGDTWGYGYNLAVHYKPCRLIAMGVSYRSEITEAGDMNSYLYAPGGGTLAYSAAHSTLTLPDSVAMGVTLYPTDRLSWEVGGVWTRWSDFNQIQFSFDRPIYGAPVITSVKNWHDTWRFQTGVEYKVLPCLDLRAGYIYDEEAIPGSNADYLLPSNDRHYFSFGPGLHVGNWSLDLAYTYVLVLDRDVSNSTSTGYINPTNLRNGNASIIEGDVSYRFW